MKNQIVLWVAQVSASPQHRRVILFGLTILVLVAGVAGVAEAGPAGGGNFP
jgi:hypothetical protein